MNTNINEEIKKNPKGGGECEEINRDDAASAFETARENDVHGCSCRQEKNADTADSIEQEPNDTNDENDEIEVDDGSCEKRSEKKKIRRLESEIEGLKKQLDAARAAVTAADDKYMRMIAEYDNYRKRSAKEKESCYAEAYADVLKALLPVLDNLERASLYGESENVAKGVELTLRSFREIFEKLGVHEIETSGIGFDPNIHYAVMHVEDENYGESEIVEVLQKGYAKGDKILRFAMVKVAN